MIVLPVPAPVSVIPLVMLRGLLQLQLPAGTLTVSPLAALLTATCTSVHKQEAAVMVPPVYALCE